MPRFKFAFPINSAFLDDNISSFQVADVSFVKYLVYLKSLRYLMIARFNLKIIKSLLQLRYAEMSPSQRNRHIKDVVWRPTYSKFALTYIIIISIILRNGSLTQMQILLLQAILSAFTKIQIPIIQKTSMQIFMQTDMPHMLTQNCWKAALNGILKISNHYIIFNFILMPTNSMR